MVIREEEKEWPLLTLPGLILVRSKRKWSKTEFFGVSNFKVYHRTIGIQNRAKSVQGSHQKCSKSDFDLLNQNIYPVKSDFGFCCIFVKEFFGQISDFP